MVRLVELNYSADSALRFQSIMDLPWAAFLDSGLERSAQARYDILVADPYLTFTTRGMTTEIRSHECLEYSDHDPLTLVAEALQPRIEAVDGLPFSGGAVGYFGYDLGRRYERLPSLAHADIDVPDMAVGIYDWAMVADHRDKRCWLVAQDRDPRGTQYWDELLIRLDSGRRPASPPFEVMSSVKSNLGKDDYARAFDRVQAHIAQGDCYQVNLTQRFSANVRGNAWHAYENLRRINPAPFSAFLQHPACRVLSSSPERFLKLTGEHVETQPIKGTRPRSADGRRDKALAEELRASEKDRAENVMIVDLLRNDLGKQCVPGSVSASRLFDVESFASVHHLVSTVEGRLNPGRHAADLLRACFPGGSITGAPKLRAMEIIESLEPQRRSVYCGAIGYIGFDGNMDTNIAIRTLLETGKKIHAWAGGGIVVDSQLESEYQESFDKAAAMLAVLSRRGSRATG